MLEKSKKPNILQHVGRVCLFWEHRSLNIGEDSNTEGRMGEMPFVSSGGSG